MGIRIHNVKIFTEDHCLKKGEILVEGDRIARVCLSGEIHTADSASDGQLDGEGACVFPGFIDLHFHGCNGYDFCDGTTRALQEIAKYEASVGVTAICPATMTLPCMELEHILGNAATYKRERQHSPYEADYVGINMEGPFISSRKKGAQDERFILPCDASVFERFYQSSGGMVKIIGIAPEEGDAGEFIRQVRDKVHISLAHTDADYQTAMLAYKAGADHAVHLYNAMPAFSHREPGVVGAVADCGHVTAELICDGVHVHPATVRSTFRMLGEERIILISDSMRATGLKNGIYTLGGQDVEVQGKYARLVSDQALAGSVTSLPDCVRTLVHEMGLPLETAIVCACVNPAKKLGIYEDYGSIAAGKKANLVFWDKELKTQIVMKDGVVIR